TSISCYGSSDGYLSLNPNADPENSAFTQYDLYKVDGDPDSLAEILDGSGDDDLVTSDITETDGVFAPALGEGKYLILGSKASPYQTGVDCYALSNAVEIQEPKELNIVIESSNVTCAGNDGTISIDEENSDTFDNYQLYKVVGDPDFDEVEADQSDTKVGASISVASTGFNGLGAGDYYVIGTVESNQEGINCTAISNIEIINLPTDCDHIYPTQTTCNSYYIDMDAEVLEEVCMTIDDSKNKWVVTNATPGVFFYYGDFTTGDFGTEGNTGETQLITVYLTQSRNTTLLGPFELQNEANVRLYDSSCSTLSYTVHIGTGRGNDDVPLGDASITFIAKEFTTYITSGKYDVKSIRNKVVTGLRSATYTFGMADGYNEDGTPLNPFGVGQIDVNDCNYSASTLATSTQSIQAESLSLETVENDVNVSPVPFDEEINLSYDLDYSSDVTIEVFDFGGNLLKTVQDRGVSKGSSTSIGVDFSIGANQMYLLRVTTDRETFVKQILSAKK
ncbi:hypothetical protein SAMN04488034_1241, partial [Salinimicrobium catena]